MRIKLLEISVSCLLVFLFPSCVQKVIDADPQHIQSNTESPHNQRVNYLENDNNADTSTVLILRGTHRERGFTHGVTRAAGVKRIFDELIITRFFRNYAELNSLDLKTLYAEKRSFIAEHFLVDERYMAEAAGIIEGMLSAGISLYSGDLEREIDSMDIIMISCVEELLLFFDNRFGCSSVSAWGESTKNDPYLNGETVITRAWDWDRKPEIMDNLLYVVHHPSEPDEQQWSGIVMAGMIGCHTVMNKSIGAFLNYGYRNTIVNGGPYRIISLTMRQSVEKADYNGDGECNTTDVTHAMNETRPYFSAIVHAVSSVSSDNNAIVLELSNEYGVNVRRSIDDFETNGNVLIATNHLRISYQPEECSRYLSLRERLNSMHPDTPISCENLWNLHRELGGVPWNQYFVLFVPSKGLFWLSKGTEEIGGHEMPPVSITLDGEISDINVSIERIR